MSHFIVDAQLPPALTR